jgi:UDP-N-acetylmuramate dehydrogenase
VRHVVLGGGSNVLVPDAGVDALVIAICLRGREHRLTGPTQVSLTVAAGEPWDELVAWTVSQGWRGLEALSGIPGLAGATPIQNVGAYGAEVSDTIVSVEVFDTDPGTLRTLEASECAFGYRDSMLKRAGGRFVVTRVTFQLDASGAAPTLRYGELTRALEGQPVTVAAVREAVLRLRRAKSMVLDANDPNRRSAGSFFMNPVVEFALAAEVARRASERGLPPPPSWPQPDGRVKLAAGWLIERSGLEKGLRVGAVGLSSAHALALVHHGGGTTTELLAFAERVVTQVRDAFGVTLEREPVLL